MSVSLRVGVIGCGRMGQCRAAAAAGHGANISFVSDPDLGLAAEVAGQFAGCRSVTPNEIDLQSVDALLICTPPSERGPIELSAIELGIPFLVEKPVGLSADSVKQIQEALAAKPVLTAVGYMNRYRKSVQAVKLQLAGKSTLGMSADWLVGMYGVLWWAQKSGSGGPINEQATHIVDLARYLVGEIAAVQAIAQPIPDHPDLIGSAAINLRFAKGQSCSMLYSCLANEKMIRLHVYTERSDFVLSGWDFHLVGDDSTKVKYEDRNQIFDVEVAAFLNAVANSSEDGLLCSFEDGLATQRVVDAIHRAVESGGLEAVFGP